jgi:hypothetical protein
MCVLNMQIQSKEQSSIIEELWTYIADYLDRTIARADVALTEAATHRDTKEEVIPLFNPQAAHARCTCMTQLADS